ncbi:MAG TPA: RNA polymerase factor sigma-54 [Planctomycetaceae bacterium]|jgi:RNA polymerase sigma-54 factor|nr:RNA polymerase factor sigma-54 [Planctomycetaceae bacterium]
MQLNLSQHMKMSQQMKLAPRMIQSMEILQLPVMALNDRIEQELQDNVVLEKGPEEESEGEAVETATLEAPAEKAVEERELVVDNEHSNEADFERLLEMSADWPEDNLAAGSRPSSNRIEEEGDRKLDAMSNMEARPPSLHDYVIEQFHFFEMPLAVREFGEYLIQNLDNNGRLQASLPEIVQVYSLEGKITLEEAQQALALVQRLDPPGVGARDYKECLLLQVRPDMPHRDVVVTLISSHMEDVKQNRLPVIERKTGYSLDDIKAAIEELRTLNPWPGQGFEPRQAERVTPDLVVDLDEHGKYTVTLLDEYTPPLRISRYYLEQLRGNPDPKTREFIKRKIDSARWLIESIEQRNNTLRRVAQAIIDHQTEYLEKGPQFIVPLKMQQIADVVGVHVTTVSRAVDDKWIQTPRELCPLKSFFGGGTKTADGEDVAWDIIRLAMKEIVDAEDKSDPLSDEALVEELAKRGYNLARRTVTKYRKAENIPSSRERRHY